ncbi:hypothetical protein ACI6QG_14720 [Roseococcus sp. DSY-14]|uniref:hypothetical protein n=1 Tax=Roseococcus sp. DSY-14 TaxID=3369650 RepID=UPI00387B5E5E
MSAPTSITVRVLLKIRRRPGRKTVVTPVATAAADTTIATRADPALVKALARAFRYQRLLDEGRYASISEMADGEKIERGYLGCLMRLTLLAPPIVEAILNGRQPEGMMLAELLKPFPVEWDRQRAEAATGRIQRASSVSEPPRSARAL